MANPLITVDQITGCLLAGGRGARMGGVDKGLQSFQGLPLALHALQRLAPQVGPLLINANRNTEAYAALGKPLGAKVCADTLPDYPGPLAGFMAALAQCQTPWLLCVPCDTPLFPLDLAAKMIAAHEQSSGTADIIIAHGWEHMDGESTQPGKLSGQLPELRAQPVFCLIKASLKHSLEAFITSGGRKIDTWTGQHRCAKAVFDRPGDEQAFANANTLAQLHALEQIAAVQQATPQTVLQALPQALQPNTAKA
ncbi:molybdenum cofactor guanylyltransferase MobA [Comamonas sp. Y33R10-2]|uniref:molybdenum cofactor guanylyltransferase MobA n=1 Tax=Comamonas sp. Y33R10-2 TaxID=2853257 RepID=UPI001C5C9B3D|nr:molybdenum cofactor guanylyltransferase MobA [Comamonas sp. Y33R10-2]QXZ10467.1 molybdenum cofactor guanylyltransferase MobA [Comamonas sp. Y33R10-2]